MIKYHRRKKKKPYRKILILACSALALAAFFITLSLLAFELAETRRLLEGIRAENRTLRSQWDKVAQNTLLLSRDTNELRGLLGFSEKAYPVLIPEGPSEPSRRSRFFAALEQVFQAYQAERDLLFYQQYCLSGEMEILLAGRDLEVARVGATHGEVFRNKDLYCSFYLEDSRLYLQSFDGHREEWKGPPEGWLRKLEAGLEKAAAHYTALESRISAWEALIHQPEFRDILHNAHLSLSPLREDYASLRYEILFEGETLLTLGLDKIKAVPFLAERTLDRIDELPGEVETVIGTLDLRSRLEKKIAAAREELNVVCADPAFQAYRDSLALSVDSSGREDGYFHYFDISSGEGKIGSFGIDKFSGELYILDKDDVPLGALESLRLPAGEIKKKLNLPDLEEFYHNPDGLSFLVCGSNEQNTDTMIIVHADTRRERITMFALPRDLYYQGGRINRLYFQAGAARLLVELSSITGLKLEKYIHLDMFAFVEVINLLGGVDLTLEQDLIDPSYKIKENGRWGTLYYPRGSYHLNGIQALRVARSRQYSSDFDRSRRQQQILMAVRDKLQKLGPENLDKITRLVQILAKYVHTNFSVFELVQFFSRYKDYSFSARHTLDTSNVLEATYSGIYHLAEADRKLLEAENFHKGAWILIPRKNDWNLIKAYIRELIGEGE